MFPDDGLCDLMYFDSIYKGNQNLLSQPQRFSENLLAFLEKTATYQQTEVGVAFAYEKVANLRADLNKSNAQPLDTFWKRGVRNFGIIDMPAFGVKASDISKVFLALRVCNHKEYAKNIKYNDRYDVMYIKKTDDMLVFSYNDEKAFCQNLCNLKGNHTSLKYGIAVYDLEYNDYHGLCVPQKSFEGSYSRIQALRKTKIFLARVAFKRRRKRGV
ncbi:hypothetical protein V5799_000782 [Amblyomma americanum]|uniref:Uncharacterized protein n=1 Tax=Amblyomma americanum TaxID=6943 RepID=A0AAQ4D221_AMBAM